MSENVFDRADLGRATKNAFHGALRQGKKTSWRQARHQAMKFLIIHGRYGYSKKEES